VPIRVLVVDDQALVRAGFRAILDAAEGIEVVGEAADGAEASQLTRTLQPAVVLLDVRMPIMDGLQALPAILAAPHGPRVLMLTTFDLDEYVFEAMRAGAAGFLLKDLPRDELAAAVHRAARGEEVFSAAVLHRLVERFVRHPSPGAAPPLALRQLSERELDVLRALAGGLSNIEIGRQLYVTEATVKTHVARILAKLGLRDRVQAVVFAYESGLVTAGLSP